MRKIIYLSLGLLMTLVGVFYLSTKSQQNPIVIEEDVIVKEDSEKKVIYGKTEAFSFKDAIKTADLIAEVEITNHLKDLNEPSPKTLFEAKLVNTFKNQKNLNEIQVLQAGNKEYSYNDNPLFIPGEKYILFLKKAIGDGYDGTDTYWILGEETNIYSVLDNNELNKWSLEDEDLGSIELNKDSMKVKNENYRGQSLNKKLFVEKLRKIIKEDGY